MRKLAKIVAPALIATLGLAAVVPAQAAPYARHDDRHDDRRDGRHDNRHNAGRPTPGRDNAIRADIFNLSRDIDRAAARRTISNREATRLKREATQVQRLYTSYARNGLTRAESRTLQNRVDQVRQALRTERRDGNNYRR